jgi:4-amino-4-deoxy-L-arabinose transferase-like glycosyltransferase
LREHRSILTVERHLLVAVLCLAWLLPGLFAHDPWKPDEAYTFGVVYEMIRGGSWIAPALAGEPFVKEPPLFYVTAAASAILFSPVLPLHDAARLATGFYVALSLVFCGLAGRELNGRGHGAVTAVLLLGCFGLVVRSHQLIPQVASLAGFAMAYYGCARALRGVLGGVWIGTGLGIVFLSQGIPEAIMVALIASLLPLVNSAWRTHIYMRALGVALVIALPWCTIWPLLLHTHSPGLFQAWLQADTFNRLYRGAGTGLYYLRMLPWYAWPVWPLAFWGLWRAFGSGPVKPAVALPLTGLIVTLLALSESADKRELYAMPLLLPLTLLAAYGVETLRRGAANAWFWFSVMGFTFAVLVAWVYWSGLELGIPARLHAHLRRLQPAYEPGFRLLPFALGVLYTLAWFGVLVKLKRSPQRPAFVWAAGVTVAWGLLAILFIGWVDSGKTYRSMVRSLESALPPTYRCISNRDLGDAQRAMLHYFAGIVTYREESERGRACDLMLVQGTPQDERAPGANWIRIWEGNRPGDRSERFRLYRRTAPPTGAIGPPGIFGGGIGPIPLDLTELA